MTQHSKFPLGNYQEDIKKIVNRFIRKTSSHLYYQQEDLLQEATLKFLEARESYKEGDVPFLSFIKTCINNHLTDYVRAEIRYNKSRKAGRNPSIPLDTEDEDDYIHESRLDQHLIQDEEEVYQENLIDLAEKSSTLTSIEKEAVIAYEERRGKVPLACVDVGVTREAFYGILNRAVNKLKGEVV